MKASPLLRAWTQRLAARGVIFRTRWRWTGWHGADARFETPDGPVRLRAGATVLALGGGSWARLGSTAPGCRSSLPKAWLSRRSGPLTAASVWRGRQRWHGISVHR